MRYHSENNQPHIEKAGGGSGSIFIEKGKVAMNLEAYHRAQAMIHHYIEY